MIQFEYPATKAPRAKAKPDRKTVDVLRTAIGKRDITHRGDITPTKAVGAKSGRGNPFVGLRMEPDLLAALERWATSQEGRPNRTEAMRRILSGFLLPDGDQR